MIQVICCSSLLSVPGRAGAFSRDFTTSLAPECRAFSVALKIEKLKAPLIPGPEGAVDTNDWCITRSASVVIVPPPRTPPVDISRYFWSTVDTLGFFFALQNTDETHYIFCKKYVTFCVDVFTQGWFNLNA